MFPYTDEEIAWINKSKNNKNKILNRNYSTILSLLIGLTTALLATTIPTIIYLIRLNLL